MLSNECFYLFLRVNNSLILSKVYRLNIGESYVFVTTYKYYNIYNICCTYTLKLSYNIFLPWPLIYENDLQQSYKHFALIFVDSANVPQLLQDFLSYLNSRWWFFISCESHHHSLCDSVTKFSTVSTVFLRKHLDP